MLPMEHQRADWAGRLTLQMLRYAQKDSSAVLLPLAGVLGARIEGAGLGRAMKIEHRALPAIARMAGAGVIQALRETGGTSVSELTETRRNR